MSWFESIEQAFDIDITIIQDTISTGLQETTKLGNIGEFLNLDALAEQQEKDDDDDDDDDEDDNVNESYDDYDNDEFISININNKKIINDNKITSTSTTNTTTTPIKKKTSRSNDDNNEDTLSPTWDWTPAKSNNINDNKDITNSAESDRLSVVDLDNSPNNTATVAATTTTIIKNDDNDNNKIKNDSKIINNTLKINKKITNNNAQSNKRIEVYASEYVGKVKKPKAKKKTKKDGLDFFGLSSAR